MSVFFLHRLSFFTLIQTYIYVILYARVLISVQGDIIFNAICTFLRQVIALSVTAYTLYTYKM